MSANIHYNLKVGRHAVRLAQPSCNFELDRRNPIAIIFNYTATSFEIDSDED
jgi:hypothetical protein